MTKEVFDTCGLISSQLYPSKEGNHCQVGVKYRILDWGLSLVLKEEGRKPSGNKQYFGYSLKYLEQPYLIIEMQILPQRYYVDINRT